MRWLIGLLVLGLVGGGIYLAATDSQEVMPEQAGAASADVDNLPGPRPGQAPATSRAPTSASETALPKDEPLSPRNMDALMQVRPPDPDAPLPEDGADMSLVGTPFPGTPPAPGELPPGHDSPPGPSGTALPGAELMMPDEPGPFGEDPRAPAPYDNSTTQ